MDKLRFYIVDLNGYYGGTFADIGPFDPVPPNAVQVATAPPTPPEGSWVVLQGDGWAVTTTPPPEPPAPAVIVPSRISKLQAELFLYGTGQLTGVQAKIAEKLAAGDEGYDIYWRSSSHFERSHLALAAIAYEMSWSPAQLDSMFIEAAKLV